jgi:hypothetical protein
MVTDQGQRLFEAKRRTEARKAAELGVVQEKVEPTEPTVPRSS